MADSFRANFRTILRATHSTTPVRLQDRGVLLPNVYTTQMGRGAARSRIQPKNLDLEKSLRSVRFGPAFATYRWQSPYCRPRVFGMMPKEFARTMAHPLPTEWRKDEVPQELVDLRAPSRPFAAPPSRQSDAAVRQARPFFAVARASRSHRAGCRRSIAARHQVFALRSRSDPSRTG